MSAEEEIVRFYSKENEQLQRQLAEAQEKIAILQGQLNHIRKRKNTSTEQMQKCREHDLYPGERREILLDVLREARKQIPDDSRRACIIDDFLQHHPTHEEPKRRAKELKDILKGYRGLDDSLRRKLRELGITTKDQHRKHYMLHYYNDPRFAITMTASGSDVGRGGKNLAADMIRKFL